MSQRLLYAVLVLAVAVGIANGTGAQNVTSKEFPYVASIRVFEKYFCTGAIINRVSILTSARCIVFLQAIPMFLVTVVTGTDSLADVNAGNVHQLAHAIPHPDFGIDADGWKREYDIGVLKLATPIVFNEMQQPISIPTNEAPLNVFADVSGWPTGTPSDDEPTNFLQKYRVKTAGEAECKKHFGNASLKNVLCSFSSGEARGCMVNSGSPLAFRATIIGVTTSGSPCGTDGPDIYADVYKHLGFIIDALNPAFDNSTMPSSDEILLHVSPGQ